MGQGHKVAYTPDSLEALPTAYEDM